MRRIFLMPKFRDGGIQISTYILLILGLLMITSATMGIKSGDLMGLVVVVVKQIAFMVAGYFAMVFCANRFSISKLPNYIEWLIIITGVSLLATRVFAPAGGAYAWIRIPLPSIGEITIQPSEFAKLSVILIIANYLAGIKATKLPAWEIIKGPLTVILLFLFIIVAIQKDFGSAMVMFFIALSTFMVCSNKKFLPYQRILFILCIVGVIAVFLILSPLGTKFLQSLGTDNYQVQRFLSAANPFADQYNHGYQLIKGLISFSTGGLFGVGFGNSIQKYTDFPAANTDYILAVLVEELGFMGFLLLFICYFVIIFKLFSYAMRIKDQKSKVILIGVAMYLFIHFLFNVGGVSGLIPLTGVPLLMISAGGSSTMSCLMAIGLAQAVIAKNRREEIFNENNRG